MQVCGSTNVPASCPLSPFPRHISANLNLQSGMWDTLHVMELIVWDPNWNIEWFPRSKPGMVGEILPSTNHLAYLLLTADADLPK